MVSSPSPQPQNVTQTQSSEPPGFVKPFITGEGDESGAGLLPRTLALSEQPFEALPGADERIAPINPLERQGLDALAALGGTEAAEISSARQNLLGTFGETPGQEPFVDDLVRTAQGDITDQFNLNVAPQIASLARASGSFGNTGVGQADNAQRFSLARALGDVESQIRAPFAQQTRQLQQQAVPLALQTSQVPFQNAQALLQAGGFERGFDQGALDLNFQNLLEQRADPFRKLDVLGAGLTTAGGGFGQTNTQGTQFVSPGQNQFISGLGGLGSFLGGAGLLKSAFRSG